MALKQLKFLVTLVFLVVSLHRGNGIETIDKADDGTNHRRAQRNTEFGRVIYEKIREAIR
jgi:hypothetical protein